MTLSDNGTGGGGGGGGGVGKWERLQGEVGDQPYLVWTLDTW